MTTEQTTPSTESPATEAKKGSWKGAVWIAVALVLLVLIAVNARVGAVSPRIRNPEVTGAPRPVEPLFGYDALARSVPDLHDHLDVHPHRCLRRGMAATRCPPGAADGHRHDVDRLAGPDHELVAVRGLQPATVALARGLAAGVAVADGRTVPGHRVHHVLPRPVLPGHLDPAKAAGAQAGRLVRVASPADQPCAASSCRSGSSST